MNITHAIQPEDTLKVERSKTAGIYYLTAGDITLVLTPDALEKIYFDTYSAIHDRKPLTTTN